jgi:hypothetical protein
MSNGKWQVLETLAILKNQWVSLIGERLLDNHGKELTYWRVVRGDSVIVIPVQKENFLICSPVYRPGVGRKTHDFPGGRHDPVRTPKETAYMILEREMGIKTTAVRSMQMVNEEPWLVDSSFSSQKLYVFEAVLDDDIYVDLADEGIECPIVQAEIILKRLICLQCRCALLDWLHQRKTNL